MLCSVLLNAPSVQKAVLAWLCKLAGMPAGLLEAENIEARPVWKPMHLQPVFRGAKLWKAGSEAVSDRLFARGLCLPSGTAMTEGDLDRVCGIVRRASGR